MWNMRRNECCIMVYTMLLLCTVFAYGCHKFKKTSKDDKDFKVKIPRCFDFQKSLRYAHRISNTVLFTLQRSTVTVQ